jgi:hypothetical protein
MQGGSTIATIVWQAALIALVVFVLALAGLMVIRVVHLSSSSTGGDTEDAITKYTFWLMAFTAVLATATILLTVATCGLWNYAAEQASDMKKSIAAAEHGASAASASAEAATRAADIAAAALHKSDEAAQLQLRSYIFVRPIDSTPANLGDVFAVKYMVQNPGRTPAKNIMLTRAVKVLPYPLPSASYPPDSGPAESAGFIGPGDTPVGLINAETALSAEDWKAVTAKDGKLRIYFWGSISYQDVFGNARYTKFCYSLPPPPPGGTSASGAIWEATPGHNDSD